MKSNLLFVAILSSIMTWTDIAHTAPPFMPTDLSVAGVAKADENLFLEDIHAPKSMEFVKNANQKSLTSLTNDPRYEEFRLQALSIFEAKDRLIHPSSLGDGFETFWQDADHKKGLWRQTSFDQIGNTAPKWEVLIDIDALSKAEDKDWVFKGADCLSPNDQLCLVSLSEGGKDAVVVREFDRLTKEFVAGGFILNEGKHRLTWLDENTILIATDFGPIEGKNGGISESGYPYIVKLWKRGSALNDAKTIFKGSDNDGGYGVSPYVLKDARHQASMVLIDRPIDTYASETYQMSDNGVKRLDLPQRMQIQGLMKIAAQTGLVITLNQDWRGLLVGDLIFVDPLSKAAPQLIFRPNARQSVQDVAVFDDKIFSIVYDRVRARPMAFSPAHNQWRRQILPMPDNVSASLVTTKRAKSLAFISVQGLLTPPSLWRVDLSKNQVQKIQSQAARFNANTHIVEQFEARSNDGTMIPYFLVRPNSMKYDAKTPIIVFGYGGFLISKPSVYIPEMGKLWLEKGGAYVIANIRGGAEFGPSWHSAVLKEKRQGAFDDFSSVIIDLHARKITSPRRTAIYGRSNGGVLTSVTMTQNPNLVNGVVIESPLVDMLRYQELPPGPLGLANMVIHVSPLKRPI